jgi:hypothetical protein
MSNRIKCTRCDNQILETTARKNHGLCAICKRDQDTAAFDATVQSWIDRPETLPGTNGIPEPKDFALALRARQLKKYLFPDAEDEMEIFCERYFDAAQDKWYRVGASGLSDKEKHALAVETFEGEVCNGGLLQYLGNESGAFANWAVDAFEAIEIPEYASVMREVKNLFPHGVIPEDPDERWDQVEAIDKDALEAVERPFWTRYRTDEKEIRRKLFKYLSG